MRRLTGLGFAITLGALAARASAAPDSPAGIHYLYLVRHGAYDRDSLADDRIANGLNRLGREQAWRVGEWLGALPVRFSSLVTSDLTRARETAAEIGASLGLTPIPDSLLPECTPEGGSGSAMAGAGTAGASCDSTLARAWAKYAVPTPAGDVHQVLVGHGNEIRWMVCRALGADTRRWRAMEIANASVTILAVRPDGTTRLVTFSDAGHLPIGEQTWTGRGPGWAPPPGTPPH